MPEEKKNQNELEQNQSPKLTASNKVVIQPSESFMQEVHANQNENAAQSQVSISPEVQSSRDKTVGSSARGADTISSNSFTPSTGNPLEQKSSTGRFSKWRYFFIFIGVLQAAGIGLFLFVMFWATMLAKGGASGTEFIALILFITVVPLVGIISLINLVGLPIYMWKYKPLGKRRVFAILSLVISALLVLYGAYNVVYGLYIYPNKLDERGKQASEQRAKEFASANTKPEITKDEAIGLLQSCQLKGFYYTNQTKSEEHEKMQFPAAETSSTGVVLVKVEGKPYRISIADRLIPELVPIAREAQKTCGSPQFWHDGSHEHFSDGKWYFKGQLVNDPQSGKTKEETIAFMQNCRADYFVGYSDINLVKDANTKSWLNKAEQSTSGIEISESSPKSYVFASKAMTTALQDTARQIRQSCYNKKKLYITIDNYIETEYPAGKWTRVKQ